jgi:hypothetical protein
MPHIRLCVDPLHQTSLGSVPFYSYLGLDPPSFFLPFLPIVCIHVSSLTCVIALI